MREFAGQVPSGGFVEEERFARATVDGSAGNPLVARVQTAFGQQGKPPLVERDQPGREVCTNAHAVAGDAVDAEPHSFGRGLC